MIIAADMAIFSMGDLLPYSLSSLESSLTNIVPALPVGTLKIFLLSIL